MAKNLIFTVNGRRCYPNYSEGISFTSSRQSEERYFRTVMDGTLTFLDGMGDYSWIRSQAFDTEFKVTITSDDGFLWRGVFYKTDCSFDADNHSVVVTPQVDDIYKRVVERMDDTIDVIKLAPKATEISLKKRGVLQTYVVTNGTIGDKIVTNWLGNMTWEETATPPEDKSESQLKTYLADKCHFDHMEGVAIVRIKGIDALESTTGFDGLYQGRRVTNKNGSWTYEGPGGNYVTIVHQKEAVSGRAETIMTLYSVDGRRVMSSGQTSLDQTNYPYPAMYAYGSYSFYDYYLRWLHDNEGASDSYRRIIDEDLTSYDANYRFVSKVAATNHVLVWAFPATSDEPTEYGKDEFGKYFTKPNPIFPTDTVFPIARSTWSPMSVWLMTSGSAITDAEAYDVPYSLRDSYPLHDIIKVLLHEIAPDPVNGITITHEGNAAYSSWLYGSNPIRMPFITPISNIKKTHYENPAQKGELSLRQVLDMLRDCFNVYWFIDSTGKFRLEHISYFTDYEVVADLTQMIVPRNLTRWSKGQNQWSYDKVKLPERIEFAYAEKQTDPFNGCVLQYLSNYVQRGEVEKVTVSGFSADIDYIIEIPSAVSDDGWVLILPDRQNDGSYATSITQFRFGGRLVAVQNAKASRYLLFKDSMRYDMSCPRYKFNGEDKTSEEGWECLSTKRVRKQAVVYPSKMPDTYGLVRTELSSEGNDGEIVDVTYTPLADKVSATLYFDTE